MEDIFLPVYKSELDMTTAGSGKVSEEIRTDKKFRSRTRSRDPHSKHRHDDEHKERHHRDKPSQERIPLS